MVTLILLLIAIVVIFILVIQRIRMRRDINKIIRVSQGIQKGNINLRYRIPTGQKDISDLGGELNRMVDYFQNIMERTAFLEDDRKRMISNISHDLRTPLTSLLGYMEALQNDQDLTEEEREEFLRITATKGNDLMKLLQEFFDLARIEANDSKPETETLNLTNILQESVLSFYPQFEKQAITPAFNIPEKPLFILGDKKYIERIMNNLLSNAFRYGVDGNEIGVSVRTEVNHAWIEVWDRGKGVSEEELFKIFERLYTGETSRNTSLQGTGLGLTITKSLVEQLGGSIRVESVPYQKTTFSFSLPLAK